MNTRTLIRTSVVTGTAAVMVGVAAPAFACNSNGPSGGEAFTADKTPSLSSLVSSTDSKIAGRQAQLQALANKVNADPNMSAAQKNAAFTQIAAEQTALSALQANVDSATSVDQVKDNLQSLDDIKISDPTTLPDGIAKVGQKITTRQAQLAAFAATIAGDPDLTAAQKAELTDQIAAAQAALTALQAKVAAATSTDELKDDLQALHAVQSPEPTTVAEYIATANSTIAARQAQLDAWAAKIAADPNLSAAQKAAAAAKIAALQAKLTALKNTIDSSTTVAEVKSALKSLRSQYRMAYPHRQDPGKHDDKNKTKGKHDDNNKNNDPTRQAKWSHRSHRSQPKPTSTATPAATKTVLVRATDQHPAKPAAPKHASNDRSQSASSNRQSAQHVTPRQTDHNSSGTDHGSSGKHASSGRHSSRH